MDLWMRDGVIRGAAPAAVSHDHDSNEEIATLDLKMPRGGHTKHERKAGTGLHKGKEGSHLLAVQYCSSSGRSRKMLGRAMVTATNIIHGLL